MSVMHSSSYQILNYPHDIFTGLFTYESLCPKEI